jgi:hypothetical protein
MVLAKDREFQALDLRKAGATYHQIGKQLGISKEGARGAVVRALADLQAICTETAEEVRRIEAERLDALTLGLWEKARKGDVAAVKACLAVMERRSKLLGLDGVEFAGDEGEVVGFDLAVIERTRSNG